MLNKVISPNNSTTTAITYINCVCPAWASLPYEGKELI